MIRWLSITAVVLAVGCARTGYDEAAPDPGDVDRAPDTCPELACDPGEWCDAGTCAPCDLDTRCGSSCEDCTLSNLVCGASGCERAVDCSGLPDFTRCESITAEDIAYDVCINGTCVSPGCGDSSCLISGLSVKLGDTGQASCFDLAGPLACPAIPGAADCATTPYCGQDAQYGWDPGHPGTTRFVRETVVPDEPVVHDDITGLMWQGCAKGASGAECEIGSPAGTPWTDAPAYCDTLTWGGYDDWYFPDENELLTTADFGRMAPVVDSEIFPRTYGYFWASTVQVNNDTQVRKLNFDGAYLSWYGKPNGYFVRCVRLEESRVQLPAVRFVRESAGGEPVVTDGVSDLAWQGCVQGMSGDDCSAGAAESLTWAEALATCEGSTWGGFDDWRLPSVMELRSIVDPRFESPAVEPTLFPATPSGYTWTSTSDPSDAAYAYQVSFGTGSLDPWGDKTSALPLRCVRRAR